MVTSAGPAIVGYLERAVSSLVAFVSGGAG
jgi:hypothetical protein